MINLAIRFIQRISRKPLVALSWTIFTASVVYMIHYYVDFPDRIEKVDEVNMKLLNLRREEDKAERFYVKWYELTALDSSSAAAEFYHRQPTLTFGLLIRFRDWLVKNSEEINAFAVEVNSAHFNNDTYENIRTSISSDIDKQLTANNKILSMTNVFLSGTDKERKEMEAAGPTDEDLQRLKEMNARFDTYKETIVYAKVEQMVQERQLTTRKNVLHT
jgi:hypothetical protein